MSHETQVSERLLRWQELRDEGRDVPAHDLCRDCPDLAADVGRRIEILRQINELAGTTAPAVAGPEVAGLPAVPGYEILGELGRGGMGVVYKARQGAPPRTVALKMVRPRVRLDPPVLARFRAEADALARLRHPNIVELYELGEANGRPYFSMEYVDGDNLGVRAGGRPQPPGESARLVELLAQAAHAAHAEGIVHRDLKPGNVLFAPGPGDEPWDTPFGRPKLADFGIAKHLHGGKRLTAEGAVLGTSAYMAPEQAAGRSQETGPATDVYALGVILYELLTGRPPFQAQQLTDLLAQVLGQLPEPPRRLRPEVPADLESICLKCLRKDAGKRYATAQALAEDLRHYRLGEPVNVRRSGFIERVVTRWKGARG